MKLKGSPFQDPIAEAFRHFTKNFWRENKNWLRVGYNRSFCVSPSPTLESTNRNFQAHKLPSSRKQKPTNTRTLSPLMAPLLLLLLFTSTTATPAPSPSPPSTLPLPPQPSSAPHYHHEQLNNIVDALIGAGDFSNWANVLSSSDFAPLIPLSATLFIPADDSLTPPAITTPPTIDPYIFPYHIVPQRLSFADLRLFKPFSRLPTLLPSKSILITNTSLSNFTLDASRLTHPDLYATSAFTVHGVANLLDYSVYGEAAASVPQPKPRDSPPSPREEYVGEHYYSGATSSLCTEIWTVFFAICATSALKILRVTNLGH